MIYDVSGRNAKGGSVGTAAIFSVKFKGLRLEGTVKVGWFAVG